MMAVRRTMTLAAVVALALTACGDPEPAGGALPPPSGATSPPTTEVDVIGADDPFDPSARMQPDEMVVDPTIAGAGQEFTVTYPGGRDRGVAYVLEWSDADSWRPTHFLTATNADDGTTPTWAPYDADGYAWESIGIGGEGPDRLVVPDDAVPGSYRVCTANSAQNICSPIDIVPADEVPMPVEPDGGIGDGAEPIPDGWLYGVERDELADAIGRPLAEFEAVVAELGWGPVRIAVDDGEPQALQDDLVAGRVNVAIEPRDGQQVVIAARVEALDGDPTPEATIVDVYEGVNFYPACGNEQLEHEGIVWYQVQEFEYPEIYDRAANGDRENPPEGAAPAGFAPRVVAPGPGDDVGTLVVWSDGVAHFASDSGDLTAWLVTDELTYEWVC